MRLKSHPSSWCPPGFALKKPGWIQCRCRSVFIKSCKAYFLPQCTQNWLVLCNKKRANLSPSTKIMDTLVAWALTWIPSLYCKLCDFWRYAPGDEDPKKPSVPTVTRWFLSRPWMCAAVLSIHACSKLCLIKKCVDTKVLAHNCYTALLLVLKFVVSVHTSLHFAADLIGMLLQPSTHMHGIRRNARVLPTARLVTNIPSHNCRLFTIFSAWAAVPKYNYQISAQGGKLINFWRGNIRC